MKRIFSLILCILLIFSMASALAADEKITIDIQPVDYQTGKAVSKTYHENELFKLRVDLTVPRFANLENMELIIECDGVEVEDPLMELTTGRYYIEGIVKAQPAAICVKAKDTSYENAYTAEDLYYAMQADRTVSDCYYFYSTTQSANPLNIPKTGDYTVTGITILAIITIAAACLFSAAKRARR